MHYVAAGASLTNASSSNLIKLHLSLNLTYRRANVTFCLSIGIRYALFPNKKNNLTQSCKNPISYGGRGKNINSIYKTIISGAVSNNTKTTRTHKKINYKVIKAKNAKFVAVKTVCIAKTQAMVRRTAFHNCCLFARSEGRRS